MAEYVKAKPEEKQDVLDFINYVFSNFNGPHEFKHLQPKCYADEEEGLGAEHYLVKEDGRIRACVACKTIQMNICSKALKVTEIGNVSVNPYRRGLGYMQKLVSWAVEDSIKENADFVILGGQRQRYGYFGFDHAGYQFVFRICDANIKHALKDVDDSAITFETMDMKNEEQLDFASKIYSDRIMHTVRPKKELGDILKNWGNDVRLIRKNGKMAGYLVGRFAECVLADEKDMPEVLKAAFTRLCFHEVFFRVATYEAERIDYISSVCESYTLNPVEQIRVINWKNILEALLLLKASTMTLDDGEAVFAIEGEGLKISVKQNVPTVEKVNEIPEGARSFTNIEAQRLFLQLKSFARPEREFRNWLPLPFFVDNGDQF